MPTSYEHQYDTLINRLGFTYTRGQIKNILDNLPTSKIELKSTVLSVINNNNSLQGKFYELGLISLQLNTRQVEIYSVVGEDKSSLDALFCSELESKNNVFNEAFPFPVENTASITSAKIGVIYPMKVSSVNFGNDEYKSLLVSTIIEKEVDEPIQQNFLSRAGLALQKDNALIFVKKKIRTQLFHAVYWNSEKSRLILSVDRHALSHTLSQEQLFILRHYLMMQRVDCGHAVNFFGAIEPIYAADDGFITKIGHVTTDGNPVRIPLKGSEKCLKQDNYHMTGEESGFVHAKFAVAKKWEFQVPGAKRKIEIEIELAGKPQMLDTSQPLTDFSVNKARRLQDFSFAIEKVLLHTQTS